MAATSMNKTSSRSHFIITFYLKLRKVPQAGGHKLSAKVSFIDLAGSEKVKKTGASGQRLKEAQSINAGLSTLSRVIEALAKKRQSIPFRDNALTWILKDSLAGNTKTTLVITCTPHQFNKAETITTCRFGSRCKLIKTHVKSNKELTPQQMKALIKKLQKENTDLKDRLEIGGDNNDNNFNENYQQKISELRDEIDKLKSQPRYDIDSKENEFDEERNELGEKIERLEAEVDNLSTELEVSDQEKKNLSVMNALLAEKLDTNISEIQNEQTVSDLFRNDLQHLKNDKDFYISELKELRFETDEIQDIFDNVFDEINKITEELVDREQDLDELEEKLIENETDIEKKNYEITRLSTQLENVDIKNRNEKKNNKNNNNKIGNEEAKYDNDVVATTFVLNLNDQEEYLMELADKEQELWEEREERAWRKYLNERAKSEGYKKGKDLLKARRNEAKQQVKDGIIGDIPEDEELLEDIRDDFYRLYDPATGEIREEDDDDPFGAETNELNTYLEEIEDENAIDDPFEWSEEEVSDWLKSISLKKYSKQFKKEGIDGKVLLVDLNKTNLKRDLGVKSVHVDKLMRSIQELRNISNGYDEWKISQGIIDEPSMNNNGVNIKQIDDVYNDVGAHHDDNINIYSDDIIQEEEESNFLLTEEEKQFGEQFWALDELFNILDIHGTGELDRGAFKHGLHALQVDLNDDDMDAVFRQIINDDSGKQEFITYKAFIQYLQFTDFLGSQSAKYAQDILSALPRVAANRRQYVTRAAMVIKYATKYNNTKTEINNYLLNKGLQRAEIDAAWKQYRFNPKAIRDIDFKSLIGKKGKLIEMAIRDPENVQ
eukprot:961878_1